MRLEDVNIDVVDWYDIGPITEARCHETGEPYTRHPDHRYCVIYITPYGDKYLHEVSFDYTDEGHRQAVSLVERVHERLAAGGDVDLDHWMHAGVVYGSRAYTQGGYEKSYAYEERHGW